MRAAGRMALKGLGDGWTQVLNRWVEDQPPETAEYLQELADIEHDSTNVQARLVTGMSYTLPIPGELSGKNIDSLAYAADSPE